MNTRCARLCRSVAVLPLLLVAGAAWAAPPATSLDVEPAPEVVVDGPAPDLATPADPGLLAGYFPNRPHPQRRAPPVAAGPVVTMRPMQVGIALTLGSHIPIAGSTHLADGTREFTGTFDMGGAFFVNVQRLVQFDFAVRGGFGGVNTDLYEERYRIPGLESRHIWLGTAVRVFPVDFFGIQPYIMGALGGDRVMAVRREPDGSFTCSDDGYFIECDPDYERVFAAGYWGMSLGYGGGLRIEPGRNGHIAILVEVQHLFNRYGRRTSSETGVDFLGSTAPRTQTIAANAGVSFSF